MKFRLCPWSFSIGTVAATLLGVLVIAQHPGPKAARTLQPAPTRAPSSVVAPPDLARIDTLRARIAVLEALRASDEQCVARLPSTAPHIVVRSSPGPQSIPSVTYTPSRRSLAMPPYTAENGSYYGQLNRNGVPKTVHVQGYFRRDGTYVRGHYRSPPGSNRR